MKKAIELWRYISEHGLKPLLKLSVSSWADEYRILSVSNAEPGRWHTSRAPYQKEIMDSFTQPGIHRVVVMSASQLGKALALDTPLATPTGFVSLRAVHPGDVLLDENGDPCTVVAKTQVFKDRPCYVVSFADGNIIADENHLWPVENGDLLRTKELKAGTKVIKNNIIVSVKPTKNVETACIEVDSASHCYLAGYNMIPTHNSDIINNVIGRFAHLDPCPIMLIQPTLEMAQDFSKTRISPMIRDTKVLAELFLGNKEMEVRKGAKTRDGNNTILSKLFPGGRLILGGANSPAGLASRPIRILLADEVDRFPDSAGSEGDPVDLAAKRTSTYWNYCIGMFSTPTNEGYSRIEQEYITGTQEEWQFSCPHCGEYHCPDYHDMEADYLESKDPQGRRNVIVKSVHWVCPDCGHKATEIECKHAPAKYVANNPEALANGARSFFLSGFVSPWVSWPVIMREWLEAEGDPTREQVVYNTRFGKSYKVRGAYDDETPFLRRREIYDADIPDGVLLLTAAVDVQDNRLEFEICGWGKAEESWGIQKGIILGTPDQQETWDALDMELNRPLHFKDGTQLKITRTFIDTGGHYTQNVYKYCETRWPFRVPIKGQGGEDIELIHKQGKARNSNVILVILGVDSGKQQVYNRLAIEDYGPNYFHFPLNPERGYDRAYFKGIISEHKEEVRRNGVIKTIWVADRNIRNEPLDLRVYNLACMKSLRPDWAALDAIRNGVKIDETPVTVKKKKKAKASAAHAAMDLWGE